MVDQKCPWSVATNNSPFVIPTFETISFSLPSVKEWETVLKGNDSAWMYLTDGNPSLAVLQNLLAEKQGVESCWVTSTGKSAISAVLMALLNQGDHIILLREGYKSTRFFVETILSRFGVTATLIGVDDLPHLATHIQPGRTKLLMLESPTNPMTRVIDLRRCAAVAREHEVITVLDNSLAGFHQHSNVGVDVIVHSLSKYASGTGDVMGGAVLGSKNIVEKIRRANVCQSDALSAHAAVEIWKGMQTYDLRIERQSNNAMAIARFLENHPTVNRVIYPGLASHPDHPIASRQMKDFGSVLTFDVKGGAAAMTETIDNLKQFRIAFGTGFTQSIANPAWLFYARSFPEAQTAPCGIYDTTIRLSVGIEPIQDLIDDLENALTKSHVVLI
jgi:cystathionine beta-lyase/cystathionine gamma-synthase